MLDGDNSVSGGTTRRYGLGFCGDFAVGWPVSPYTRAHFALTGQDWLFERVEWGSVSVPCYDPRRSALFSAEASLNSGLGEPIRRVERPSSDER